MSLVEKGSQEQERTRTGSDTERRTVYHARKKNGKSCGRKVGSELSKLNS